MNKRREIENLNEELARVKEKLALYESDNYARLSNLLRVELGLVKMNIDFTPQMPNTEDIHHYFYGLSQDEIKNFMFEAKSLFENPTFKPIIRYFLNSEGNHAVMGSRSQEENFISRGEMSGFARIFHEYQALAEAYKSMQEPEKKFDPNEII